MLAIQTENLHAALPENDPYFHFAWMSSDWGFGTVCVWQAVQDVFSCCCNPTVDEGEDLKPSAV